jgi:hypothetical protein
LRSPAGIEAVPLGTFFVEIHPALYLPAGFEVMPAVAPDVLHRALGSPEGRVVFLQQAGGAVAIEESAFVPLESALLDAPAWDAATARTIDRALDAVIELQPGPLGLLPLAGTGAPNELPALASASKDA